MGLHGDDDFNGTINRNDPNWRPDARDEHAHSDEDCDQFQESPARWIGITRDPSNLPIGGEYCG